MGHNQRDRFIFGCCRGAPCPAHLQNKLAMLSESHKCMHSN